MLQAIVGYHLVKGLKANKIQVYLASIKSEFQVRGLECPALEHRIVQTFMRGSKIKSH